MKTTLSRAVPCCLLALCAAVCSAADPVPPGAAALGYTKRVINERPVASDIAPQRRGNHKWYSGQWYFKTPPPLSLYRTTNGALEISLGGDLVSLSPDMSDGRLPLLPGNKGFYVEFEVQLSGNDPDHFPAVWLMPAEHGPKERGKFRDHYSGDPDDFERWMELDVDEGGFGPGLTGTVHAWTGIYPNYQNLQNPGNVSKVPLDRTQKHVFGASYDPIKSTVTWWVDGQQQHSAGPPHVPAIGAKQRFYLIMSAQTHGKKVPYQMWIHAVRAYVPPSSPLSAK